MITCGGVIAVPRPRGLWGWGGWGWGSVRGVVLTGLGGVLVAVTGGCALPGTRVLIREGFIVPGLPREGEVRRG